MEPLIFKIGGYLAVGLVSSITVGIWAHKKGNKDGSVLLEALAAAMFLAWPIIVPIVIIHTHLKNKKKNRELE